jgi:hypothetical protein
MFKKNGTKRVVVPTPLPLPGESLQMELARVLFVKVETWLIAAVILCVWAAMDWARWYWSFPPTPVVTSIFALVAVVVSGVVLRRAMVEVRNIKL